MTQLPAAPAGLEFKAALKGEAVIQGVLHYHDASGAVIKEVTFEGTAPIDLSPETIQELTNGPQHRE